MPWHFLVWQLVDLVAFCYAGSPRDPTFTYLRELWLVKCAVLQMATAAFDDDHAFSELKTQSNHLFLVWVGGVENLLMNCFGFDNTKNKKLIEASVHQLATSETIEDHHGINVLICGKPCLND